MDDSDPKHKEIRDTFMKNNGLDELESVGLDVKNSIHRIWKGERDLTKLTTRLDMQSSIIIKKILNHSISFDSMFNTDNERNENIIEIIEKEN